MNKIIQLIIVGTLCLLFQQNLYAQCTVAETPTITTLNDMGGGTVEFGWDANCGNRGANSICGPNDPNSVVWYFGFYGQNSPAPNGLIIECGVRNVEAEDDVSAGGACNGANIGNNDLPISNGGTYGAQCLDAKGSTCVSSLTGQLINGALHTFHISGADAQGDGGYCDAAGTFLIDLCPGQCYNVIMWELIIDQPSGTGPAPQLPQGNTLPFPGIDDNAACGNITIIDESPASTPMLICMSGTNELIENPTLTASSDLGICASTTPTPFTGTYQLTPEDEGDPVDLCIPQDIDIQSVLNDTDPTWDGSATLPAGGGTGNAGNVGDLSVTSNGVGNPLTLGDHVIEVNCRESMTIGFSTPTGCDGVQTFTGDYGLPPCTGEPDATTNAKVYITNNGIAVAPNTFDAYTPSACWAGNGNTNTCTSNQSSGYPADWTAQFGAFVGDDGDYGGTPGDVCLYPLAGNPFAGAGSNPFDLPGTTQHDFGDGVLRDVSTVCVRYEDPCDGSKSATCIKFISDSSPLVADVRSCPVTCTTGTGTTGDGQIIVENLGGGSADGNQDFTDDTGATTSIANYFVEIVAGPSTGALTATTDGSGNTDWQIGGLAAGVYTVEIRDELATGDTFDADGDNGTASCGAACPIQLTIEVLGPPINTLVANPGILPSCADAQEYTTDLSATQITTASNGQVTFSSGPGAATVDDSTVPGTGATATSTGLFTGCASDNIGAVTIAEVCITNFAAASGDLSGTQIFLYELTPGPPGAYVNLSNGTAFGGGGSLSGSSVTTCFTANAGAGAGPDNAGTSISGIYTGFPANGLSFTLSVNDGFNSGDTYTWDDLSITFNDVVCNTTTGIVDFAACAGATAGAAPADTPNGILTWTPNSNGTDTPAAGDVTFTDAAQTAATFTDPSPDQTANTYCYTVTGYLPGSNFTADGLDLSCDNGQCCQIETEVCFSTQPCFSCGDVEEPKTFEYWLCEGAALPADEGLQALCPDCEPNPTPFCAFDPNTMNVTVCISGIHTYVSDMSMYLQSPNGVVIDIGPYANSGTAGNLGNCNSGNDFNDLCFTNIGGSGDFNVCNLGVPLTGTFDTYYGGQAINWAAFSGQNIFASGWNVILGDCVGGDVGELQNAVATFSDNGGGSSCLTEPACIGCDGLTELAGPNNGNSVVYDSGPVNFTLDDNECQIGVDNPAVFAIPIPPAPLPFPSGVIWYDVATGGTPVATGNTFQPSDLAPGDYSYWAECECDGYNTEGDCANDIICNSDRVEVIFHIYEQDAGTTTVDNQILCCGETANFDNVTALYDETLAGGSSPKHDYELGYAITSGSHAGAGPTVASQADLDALPTAQVFMAGAPDDINSEAATYTTTCTACPAGTTGTLTAGVWAITPFTSVDAEEVCAVFIDGANQAQTDNPTFEAYTFNYTAEGSLNNTAVPVSTFTLTIDIFNLIDPNDGDGPSGNGCEMTDINVFVYVNNVLVAVAGGLADVAQVVTFTEADFTFNSNDDIRIEIANSTAGNGCVTGMNLTECKFYYDVMPCLVATYEPTFDDVGEGAMCAEYGQPADFVVLDPICATETSTCNADGTYSVEVTIGGGLAALDGATYVDNAGATITIDGGYSITSTGATSIDGTAGAGPVIVSAAGTITIIYPNGTPTGGYSIDIANYDENTSTILSSAASTTGCPINITGEQLFPDPPTVTAYSICEDAAIPAGEGLIATCGDCPAITNPDCTETAVLTNNGAAASPFGGADNANYHSYVGTCTGTTIETSATSLSLTVDVANYNPNGLDGDGCNASCGVPPTSAGESFWVTVIVDGVIVYDDNYSNTGSYPGPFGTGTGQALPINFTQADFVFNQSSTIDVYVYPNCFSGCGALTGGVQYQDEWTADVSTNFSATFPGTSGTASPATLSWWNMSTGGTQQGTVSPLDPTGLTAEEGAFDISTPGDYTFYAQCECSGCASTRTPVVFTVVPSGVATGDDVEVCEGEVANIMATISSGSITTGVWSGGTGTFGSTTSLSTTYTHAAAEAGTTVTLTFTPDAAANDLDPTCVTPVDIDVTIFETPDAPVGTNDIACQNTTVGTGLTATGCTGGTINWFDALTGGNPEGTGSPLDPSTATTNPVDLAVPGDYSFFAECTSADGCIGPRTEVIFTVTPPIGVTTPPNVCTAGTNTGIDLNQITIDVTGGLPSIATTSGNYDATDAYTFGITGTGAYNPGSGVTPDTGTATDPGTFVFTDGANGIPPGVYTVTVTDASGCSANIEVNVYDPLIVTAQQEACGPNQFVITFGDGGTDPQVFDPACYDFYLTTDPGGSIAAADLVATPVTAYSDQDPGGVVVNTWPYTLCSPPTPANTQVTFENVDKGDIYVVLIDDNGCQTINQVQTGPPLAYDPVSLIDVSNPCDFNSFTVQADDGRAGAGFLTDAYVSSQFSFQITAGPSNIGAVMGGTPVNGGSNEGPATATFSGLSAGTYTIQVTDAGPPATLCPNDPPFTEFIQVNVYDPLVVNNIDPFCDNDNSARLTINFDVSGGLPGFDFGTTQYTIVSTNVAPSGGTGGDWDLTQDAAVQDATGTTAFTFSMEAGTALGTTLTVVIQDDNGCEVTFEYTTVFQCCVSEAGYIDVDFGCPAYDDDGNIVGGDDLVPTIFGYENIPGSNQVPEYYTYVIVADAAGNIYDVILYDFVDVAGVQQGPLPVSIPYSAFAGYAGYGIDYYYYSYNVFANNLPPAANLPNGISLNGVTGTASTIADVTAVVSPTDGCFDLSMAAIDYMPAPLSVQCNVQTYEGNQGGVSPFHYSKREMCIKGGTPPFTYEWYTVGYVRNAIIRQEGDELDLRVTYDDNADWAVTITDYNGCTADVWEFTNELDDVGQDGDNPVLDIKSATITGDDCHTRNVYDGTICIEASGGSQDGDTPDFLYEWTGPVTWNGGAVLSGMGLNCIEDLPYGWYAVTVTETATLGVGEEVLDGDVTEGWYWVECERPSGRGKVDTDVASVKAYPNPFSQVTSIEFSTLKAGNVSLALFSLDGKQLVDLYNGKAEANTVHEIQFEAGPIATGIYMLQMITEDGQVAYEKLIIAK